MFCLLNQHGLSALLSLLSKCKIRFFECYLHTLNGRLKNARKIEVSTKALTNTALFSCCTINLSNERYNFVVLQPYHFYG